MCHACRVNEATNHVDFTVLLCSYCAALLASAEEEHGKEEPEAAGGKITIRSVVADLVGRSHG